MYYDISDIASRLWDYPDGHYKSKTKRDSQIRHILTQNWLQSSSQLYLLDLDRSAGPQSSEIICRT